MTTATFRMRGYQPCKHGSTVATGRICRESKDGKAWIVQITGPDRRDWGVIVGEYVRVEKSLVVPFDIV